MYIGKAFSAPLCSPPALPLVRCYSMRLPWRVVRWVKHSRQWTESCPVGTTSVISACSRLMTYDVKISGAPIRTHDLRIRKQVCYPLHRSAPISSNDFLRSKQSQRRFLILTCKQISLEMDAWKTEDKLLTNFSETFDGPYFVVTLPSSMLLLSHVGLFSTLSE